MDLTLPCFRYALRESLQKTREILPFSIEAWVLLPDHIHCVWTLPSNDDDFSTRWSFIKRYVSQQVRGQLTNELTPSRQKRRELGLWQRRFWEHLIGNEQDFNRHIDIDYVHWNPVKHGYVSQVVDYPYSTFHRYVKQGIYSPNWGCAYSFNDQSFGE